jgi:hypothetical protein
MPSCVWIFCVEHQSGFRLDDQCGASYGIAANAREKDPAKHKADMAETAKVALQHHAGSSPDKVRNTTTVKAAGLIANDHATHRKVNRSIFSELS